MIVNANTRFRDEGALHGYAMRSIRFLMDQKNIIDHRRIFIGKNEHLNGVTKWEQIYGNNNPPIMQQRIRVQYRLTSFADQ